MATTLNLRKASALQTALQDMLKEITVKTSIDLTEFKDPVTEINSANVEFFAQDTKRNDLLMSIYSIRSLVGIQNAISGVTARLTHIAYIDKRIAQLEHVVSGTKEMTDLDIIAGKLEKIRNRKEENTRSIYGHTDEVTTAVLTAEQLNSIRGVIRDLRKQKANLNDEILELNIKSMIELTPDVEAVLTREGLI